jgi:hypothetical protein
VDLSEKELQRLLMQFDGTRDGTVDYITFCHVFGAQQTPKSCALLWGGGVVLISMLTHHSPIDSQRSAPTRAHTANTFMADPPSHLDGSLRASMTPRSARSSGAAPSPLSTPRSTGSTASVVDDKIASRIDGRLVSLRRTLKAYDASYRFAFSVVSMRLA